MPKQKYIPSASRGESAPKSEEQNSFHDLGFSNSVHRNRRRFINKDGTFNVLRDAGGIREWHVYQWLVLMSWSRFFGVTWAFYIIINSIFASLYMLNGIEHLSGAGTDDGLGGFCTAFFFSVQTLTTVGYGSVSPMGFGANMIAALGALTGLLSFALVTGLLFARFSKPTASILFSDNALIAPYKDGNALMFRLANQRKNMLTNLRIEVIAAWLGENDAGEEKRHYIPLGLERSELSMLPMSWTVVHPIDDKSPLQRCTEEVLQQMDLEIMIILEGYDDTFANIIRTHFSYKYDELRWNSKFERIFHFDEEGRTVLELDKLNAFSKVS